MRIIPRIVNATPTVTNKPDNITSVKKVCSSHGSRVVLEERGQPPIGLKYSETE